MNNENTNFYIFLSELAITYRLSLDNLCRLLGLEINDLNKKQVFDKLLECTRTQGKDLIDTYEYLFNYETINENVTISTLTRIQAKKFISKYKTAYEAQDHDKIVQILDELTYVDREFKNIKQSLKKQYHHPTIYEMKVIAEYRLKYALPQVYIEEELGVFRDYLYRFEQQLEPSILKEKLTILNGYHKIRHCLGKHSK